MAVTYAFTYNVKNYGAKGDGVTDDWSAINLAIGAAQVANKGAGMLYFPSSTGGYVFSKPLDLHYVGMLGDGPGSVLLPRLSPTLPFGSGPAIDVGGQGSPSGGVQPILEKFTLKSPVTPVSLSLQTLTTPYGFSPAVGDGIWIEDFAQVFLNNVTVEGFDRGIVYTNTQGHIYLDECIATNNFYGVWVQHSTGDYLIRDSNIAGNRFANIGVHPSGGLNGMHIVDSQLGQAPFGIFQEPNPLNSGPGFVGMQLSNATFEQIGNGAIYAEIAATTVSDKRASSTLQITAPYFTWNTIAYMPTANTPTMSAGGHYYLGKPRDYAVQLGALRDMNRFEGDNVPFTKVTPSPGFVNSYVYHFYAMNAYVEIRDDFSHVEDVLVDTFSGYDYDLTAGNTDLFPRVYMAGFTTISSSVGFTPLPIITSDPVKGITFLATGGGGGMSVWSPNRTACTPTTTTTGTMPHSPTISSHLHLEDAISFYGI